MCENSIDSLLCRLYDLCISKMDDKGGNRIAKGHEFEDETSEQIYHAARDEGFDPAPPRTTLSLQTRSCNVHQFDASFRTGKDIYVIECKNTREAAKDYLYVFNAKILDYAHALRTEQNITLRGIFLSTVPVVQSAWCYGLAYGIRIVDPDSPPPEYMKRSSHDQLMVDSLEKLIAKMTDLADGESTSLKPPRILEEYRFLYKRWKDGLQQSN